MNRNQENNEKQEQETNAEQEKILESKEEEIKKDPQDEEVIQNTQEKEAIKEPKKKKGSYITGTIGAILGGLVASIPWILTYSFANMIIAALAILIAGGAYLGYKIFKGRIGKGFPVILTIVSLLIVTIVTTVICPLILIAKSGYNVTFYNLESLYVSENRANVGRAIIQDLIISLIFTIIGIAAIVRSIWIQIKNGATSENLKFSSQTTDNTENKELIKPEKRRKKVLTIIIVLLIIAVCVVAGCIVLSNKNKEYTVTGTNLKLNIDETQKLYGTKEEISEEIGEATAQYYDFIIEEIEEKYEISGQIIKKSEYGDTDINTIVQEDRNNFAEYFGEEETSAVEEKELDGKTFRFYSYNYISNTDKECRTNVYLYEEEENYLWIEVRSLREIETTEIDQVIENLFK